MKQLCTSLVTTELDILIRAPKKTNLPPVIRPEGLPRARQAYLYKEIRMFCREGTEDVVCPEPPPKRPAETSNYNPDLKCNHDRMFVGEDGRKGKKK